MSTIAETKIEADPSVPIIRITREFAGTPEQLFRAHTDPKLFAQWIGPSSLDTRIDEWDVRSGGSWRFVSTRDGEEHAFRGCFHEVRPDRIVQTFTYEGDPDGVALETLWFTDLGNGRTQLRTQSLVDSFASRVTMSRLVGSASAAKIRDSSSAAIDTSPRPVFQPIG